MKEETKLKDQSDEQLENLINDIDVELFELKNELATAHKLEKPHLIKQNKKMKARINTILTERKKALMK